MSMKMQAAFRSIVALSLLLVSSSVWPQPSDDPSRAAAKVLYDEAVALMDKGNYSEACPLIEQALKLYPDSVGAQVTRGDCYKEWGRLASAIRAYTLARTAAKAAGDEDREQKSRERAAEIVPKVSTLTIVVPDAIQGLPGVRVKRDADVVERKDWGAAVPVDGGTYRIEVTATGKRPWTKTVDVKPSEAREVVNVGGLENAETVVVSPSTPSSPSQPPADISLISSTPAEGSIWSTPRTLGVLAGVLGVVGVAAGIYYGLQSKELRDESRLNGHCVNGNECDAVGAPLLKQAVSQGNIATALFVPGAVLFAGGVTLLIWAPRAPSEPDAKILLGPQTLEFRGRW